MIIERRLLGDPILYEVQPPVENIGDHREVIEDLIDSSLDWENSLGLAAPQIGYKSRIFVSKNERGQVTVHINPQIIRKSAETAQEIEGCGSIPDRRFVVERPMAIMAKWTTPEGRTEAMGLSGMPARIFQHELDHLDGILISDIGEEVTDGTADHSA